MNDQMSPVAEVDIGTPPSRFKKWELANVYVHGFADLPMARDEVVQSPEFSCLGHQWRLTILPGGGARSDNEMVAIYLCNMSNESIEVDYFFSVRNSDGEEVADRVSKKLFPPCASEEDICAWGDRNFSKRQTILESLSEGTLTIMVYMRTGGPGSCSSQAFVPKNPIGKNILAKFMDEESADVVFEVGGGSKKEGGNKKRAKTSPTTFHAHRLILQDGAPLLGELCKPRDGGSPAVLIADVKPDIFRRMLHYVYGGEMSREEMKENAKDLIDAADKFGVVSLKLEAEACYVKSTTFTIDNIIDNLLYSDSKNCALLKEAVMDYMAENGNDLIGKVSFQDVPGTTVQDLLVAMARGKKKSDSDSDNDNLKTMRVGTLRKTLHEKGLDVDGSKEAMIARLKAPIERSWRGGPAPRRSRMMLDRHADRRPTESRNS